MTNSSFVVLFAVTVATQTLALKALHQTAVCPTGSYYLQGEIEWEGEDSYDRHGEIRVNQLKWDEVLVDFQYISGQYSHNLGIFNSKLYYSNDIAVYQSDRYGQFVDLKCCVILQFNGKGIIVTHITTDPTGGCGFGNNVFVEGFYIKKSSKIPIIERGYWNE